MTSKLVKFKDGQYAIRKWSLLHFGHVYLDLSTPRLWWGRESRWFAVSCRGPLDQVKRAWGLQYDLGTPVGE